ncbi:MAG TPA: molybdenum cofactor guanylyltransferase [Pyrinomonadaceae bacterium]|jgi:molybdopterin-guanine dinucleotide biosynthesis protein A|nr:molybdenum cofactor guanylyltransferase [Pyrinomonadaceae bacterium]
MLDAEGFILAGGASSRMGTDKARLRLGAQTFVERIAHALASATRRVSVVSAKPDASEWGLPVVADIYAGAGALGGIHAALSACAAEWAVLVSCDLPFVTGELLTRLVAFGAAGVQEFDAVAPLQTDGRPQPLCTLYRRERCLARAGALLQAGERRPRVLLREVRTRWVLPEELNDLSGAGLFFLNVNTPEDYARARALAANEATEAG